MSLFAGLIITLLSGVYLYAGPFVPQAAALVWLPLWLRRLWESWFAGKANQGLHVMTGITLLMLGVWLIWK